MGNPAFTNLLSLAPTATATTGQTPVWNAATRQNEAWDVREQFVTGIVVDDASAAHANAVLIQAAADAVVSGRRRTIGLPAGNIYIDRPIHSKQAGQWFLGDPSGTTVLQPTYIGFGMLFQYPRPLPTLATTPLTGNGSGSGVGNALVAGANKYVLNLFSHWPIVYGLKDLTAFTWERWVKNSAAVDVTSPKYHIFCGADYGAWSNEAWSVRENSNGGFDVIWDNVLHATANSIRPSSGVWYHIALTWNGSLVKLWLGGSEVLSFAYSGVFPVRVRNREWVAIGYDTFSPLAGEVKTFGGPEAEFAGDRISSIARYTAGFTPTMTNKASDANTLFVTNYETDDPFILAYSGATPAKSYLLPYTGEFQFLPGGWRHVNFGQGTVSGGAGPCINDGVGCRSYEWRCDLTTLGMSLIGASYQTTHSHFDITSLGMSWRQGSQSAETNVTRGHCHYGYGLGVFIKGSALGNYTTFLLTSEADTWADMYLGGGASVQFNDTQIDDEGQSPVKEYSVICDFAIAAFDHGIITAPTAGTANIVCCNGGSVSLSSVLLLEQNVTGPAMDQVVEIQDEPDRTIYCEGCWFYYGSVPFTLAPEWAQFEQDKVVYSPNSWVAGDNRRALTLTYASTIEPDARVADIFDVVLAGNPTIEEPLNYATKKITFRLKQDPAGSRTVTWASIFRFPASTPSGPTLSTAAGRTDSINFQWNTFSWCWDYEPSIIGLDPQFPTLLEGLVSHWSLDESSAGSAPVTRNDSAGTNHLTDTNTTPSAAGKIGNGARFTTADTDRLTCASNSTLQVGGGIDWAFCGWVKVTATGSYAVWGKDNGVSPEWSFFARTDVNVFSIRGYNGASYQAVNFTGCAINTWYFIAINYVGATKVLSLDVNVSGTPVTVTMSNDIPNGTDPFFISSNVGSFSYLTGITDELRLYKGRILNLAEQRILYGPAGTPPDFD